MDDCRPGEPGETGRPAQLSPAQVADPCSRSSTVAVTVSHLIWEVVCCSIVDFGDNMFGWFSHSYHCPFCFRYVSYET